MYCSKRFVVFFILVSIMVVKIEARRPVKHERLSSAVVESFRAMLRGKMLLEEGNYKPARYSPGGPDPQHHFNAPLS
ncbi:hypothetical protein ABFS83_13G033600 [Erythranthe nasuta]